MSDTSIRISTEAKQRLELLKREGESFDDVIRRLASRDKWAGFGVLESVDGDGIARIREAMRRGMDEDVEGTASN